MASIAALSVSLRANTRRFNNSMRRSQRVISGLQKRILAIAGVGGLGLLAKRSLDLGDRIDKLSIRLGANAAALSAYQVVAERSGVSFNTFTLALQRMARRSAEAAQGTGEAKAALAELGVDAQRFAKLRPTEQFEALAKAFDSVKNQSDKLRLAFKLFDSEGVSVLQIFAQGAEGIARFKAEANQLHVAMSEKTVKGMAAAKDAIKRVGDSIQGVSNLMVGEFSPAFTDIANGFANELPLAIDRTLVALDKFDRRFQKAQASLLKRLGLGDLAEVAAEKQAQFLESIGFKSFAEAARNQFTSAQRVSDIAQRAQERLSFQGPGTMQGEFKLATSGAGVVSAARAAKFKRSKLIERARRLIKVRETLIEATPARIGASIPAASKAAIGSMRTNGEQSVKDPQLKEVNASLRAILQALERSGNQVAVAG